MLQGCRLFKLCQNLPAGHCAAGVQTVYEALNLPAQHCFAVVQAVKSMSEPTCRALCYRVADCLSDVRTYLPALCYRGAGCILSNV